MPRFSRRTAWPTRPNRLSELLESRRREGTPLVDLTLSNPTEAALPYPGSEILRSLADPSALRYTPDPHGLASARNAVCEYYRAKNISLSPADVILTASTSEAYAHAFTLLCEPGDEILIPAPSYPLFEYLAQLSGVTCRSYHLRYDQGWHIDSAALAQAVTASTRAIVLIHPHNPTGLFLRRDVLAEIRALAREHDLALIVDEVFADYAFAPDPERVTSCALTDDVLTFTLSGLSKLACLPQMKLGWMVLSGPAEARAEARERLETVCDTFLSVNTPVQVALGNLLRLGEGIRGEVRGRITENDRVLRELCTGSAVTALACEGGWYGILRMPKTRTDEEWAVGILAGADVAVYPGYFFDIEECTLVVSLLAEAAIFADGIGRIVRFASEATSPSPR